MEYFLKRRMYYVTQTNVKKTFDFIVPMISKKIHLKYIESAILDKINIGLLFNRMTINGNVMCFLVFFKSLQNHNSCTFYNI